MICRNALNGRVSRVRVWNPCVEALLMVRIRDMTPRQNIASVLTSDCAAVNNPGFGVASQPLVQLFFKRGGGLAACHL